MQKSVDSSNYIHTIHNELLEIMDEIDRVCTEHNLRYYLIGGSLLGAIRHNGFIPWDDDLDIAMPRKDYQRFIDIAPKELHEPYKLMWTSTDKKYWKLFAKVENANTVFQEAGMINDKELHGIFVDIFPLDETDGLDSKVRKRKTIIKKLGVMMSYKTRPWQASMLKRIIVKPFPIVFLSKMANRIMFWPCKTGQYYSNFGSRRTIDKQTIPKEFFANGVPHSFEDRQYNVPSNADSVLNHIFGSSYMDIPPKEKQRGHYPIYVQFSDGQEVRFPLPEKELSIEDE